ncbi:MAG TPA: FtsX-like permease family protein [Ruminiclostridium sp.]|nr:FtsX-like permease family protein [Ruminiclostridium sp.]
MTSFLKLLRANIRSRKGSFISIAVLMLIITLVASSVVSVYVNSIRRDSEALKETGYGDIVVYMSGWALTGKMLNAAKNCDGVDHITTTEMMFYKSCLINSRECTQKISICEYEPDKMSFNEYNNAMNGFSGKAKPLSAGEIYLPVAMARSQNCKIGDTVTLGAGTKHEFKLKIRGFIEEPMLGSSVIYAKSFYIGSEDFKRISAAAMSYQEYLAYGGKSGCYPETDIGIYTIKHDTASISAVKKTINNSSGLFDQAYTSLTQAQSNNYTMMIIKILCSILLIFIVLLFAVVLLVMGHSISTSIELDYVNLGILKANGFTNVKLSAVLLAQYVFAGSIGAVAGLAFTTPAVHIVAASFVSVTGLLASSTPVWTLCIPFVFGFLAIIAVFVLLKVRMLSMVSPVRAINGGRGSVYFSDRLTISTLCSRASHVNLKLSLRQLTSNKKQYAGVLAIVALLVYFLISMVSMNDSYSKQNLSKSFGIAYYDLSVEYTAQGAAKADVERNISKFSPIVGNFGYDSQYCMLDGVDKYFALIYSEPTIFQSVYQGRAPRYKNEIIITKLVSDELGKGIGDIVSVRYKGSHKNFIVTGIMQSMAEGGSCFGILTSGMQYIDSTYKPAETCYLLKNSDKADNAYTSLERKYPLLSITQRTTYADMLTSIKTTIDFLESVTYGLAVMFLVIIVSMLCKRMVLRERRDLGILKAQGFAPSRLRLQFCIRFLIVAVFGSVLGVLLNLAVNDTVLNLLLSGVGLSHCVTVYTAKMILVPAIMVCVLFTVVSYLATAGIRRISTRELISE